MTDRQAPPFRKGAPACRHATACRAAGASPLPGEGSERTLMLVLRFAAAAGETGDACCWDAAFDEAESAFGDRNGALLVARAAAFVRRITRSGHGIGFLPPPCRRMSGGETALLESARAYVGGREASHDLALPDDARAALADLVAALRPPAGKGRSSDRRPAPRGGRSAPVPRSFPVSMNLVEF